MKRRWLVLASAVLLGSMSTQGWAEALGLGKMDFDGTLEVLGQQAKNETDMQDSGNDHRGNTITRVRLGANFPVAEDVTGRVELVRNSDSGSANVQYGDGNTTVQTEQNIIDVQNAYVDITGFLETDLLRVGRQYGGRRGDLILYYGPRNNDALSVVAADSVLVKKKVRKIDALFATGKVTEDDSVPGGGTETDADGAGGDINVSYLILSSDELFSSVKVPVEVGYYQVKDSNGTSIADNQTLVIYDVRASYAFMDGAANVSGEYAMNAGKDNNGAIFAERTKYSGSAYVVKGDYKNEDRRLGLHAFMANATGDKQTGTAQNRNKKDKAFHDGGFLGGTASDFRYGEILSNSDTLLSNYTGGSVAGAGLDTGSLGFGLNVFGLGASWVAPVLDERVTLTGDYYVTKVNEVPNNVDDGVGKEIDVAAHYRHSDAVSAILGYATFSPDTGFASGFAASPVNVQSDKVTKAWAKLIVKWGGAVEEEKSIPAAPASKKKR